MLCIAICIAYEWHALLVAISLQNFYGSQMSRWWLQLVMNIPFTALYFASYESAKRAMMKHANCEESLLIQGVAGACFVLGIQYPAVNQTAASRLSSDQAFLCNWDTIQWSGDALAYR